MKRMFFLWGIGCEAKKYNKKFFESIDGIVDENPQLHGKAVFNKIVKSPDEVLKMRNVFFIISVLYEYDDIKAKLIENGYEEKKDFIWGPYWYGNDRIPETYGFNDWKSYDKTLDFSEDIWMKRAKIAVKMIPECKSVADMGAGAMTIKKLLNQEVKYYPIDYCKRFEETIVCDFNNGEYPDLSVDVVFALGVLEYIQDAELFIKKICNMASSIIFSYNCIEKYGNLELRQKRGWMNHFKVIDLLRMFKENGYSLVDERLYGGAGILFRFEHDNSKLFMNI